MDIIARGSFVGFVIEKSSYKHVSDFECLQNYDILEHRKNERITENIWEKNNEQTS